jgi:predicted nucleic acid-binding Zn ribbon protein
VELDVRRAFTSVQLRTILEENHHSFLIVEHRRYERARDMAGHVAQAMKQASRGEGGHPPVRPCIGPAPGAGARRPGLLLL